MEASVSRQQAYRTQDVSINQNTLAETGYSFKNKCLSKVNTNGLLTSPLTEILNFKLIVCMVRVTKIQEIELRISYFILSYTGFKLWAISGNETCSLVNNVCGKNS